MLVGKELERILYKAIYEFKKKGSNVKDLNVVIGPCISKGKL